VAIAINDNNGAFPAEAFVRNSGGVPAASIDLDLPSGLFNSDGTPVANPGQIAADAVTVTTVEPTAAVSEVPMEPAATVTPAETGDVTTEEKAEHEATGARTSQRPLRRKHGEGTRPA
jgi:hypothetical protein